MDNNNERKSEITGTGNDTGRNLDSNVWLNEKSKCILIVRDGN